MAAEHRIEREESQTAVQRICVSPDENCPFWWLTILNGRKTFANNSPDIVTIFRQPINCFQEVYTESTLVEQTTPVSLQFFDRSLAACWNSHM